MTILYHKLFCKGKFYLLTTYGKIIGMRFSKFLINTDLSEVAHTSGHARAAFGDRLGSASNMTFNERQKIDSNRKTIAGYNKSRLGLSGVARSTRAVTPQDIAKIQAKDHLKAITEKNYANRRSKSQFGEQKNTGPSSFNPYRQANQPEANNPQVPIAQQIRFKEPEPRNFQP